MAKFNDLTGKKFGRLTVLGFDGRKGKYKKLHWICVCDCGEIRSVDGKNLTSGNSKSCGCLKLEMISRVKYAHGKAGSKVYRAWKHMRARCRNKNDREFKNYGGRGIEVCKRWQKFENFYADMGDPPPGTSLDRINVNGNYEPTNCRWATAEEQQNNRRNNRVVKYDGEDLTLMQLAEKVGMKYDILRGRLDKGWSLEKAIGTPVKQPPTFEYKGEKLTLTQIAEKVGINYNALSSRLRYGWSIERAVETPVQQPATFEYRDEILTVAQLAKRAGIRPGTLDMRLKSGWSLEKAIETPVRKS